jgi:hypothetical protein
VEAEEGVPIFTTCVPQTTLGALITGEGKALTVTTAVAALWVVTQLVSVTINFIVFTPEVDQLTEGLLP